MLKRRLNFNLNGYLCHFDWWCWPTGRLFNVKLIIKGIELIKLLIAHLSELRHQFYILIRHE